ncbi:hypothetical protein SVIO_017710 [Streptomyces violaceusniger]|uniref:ABC transporter permease n=1 Tax=Streptomyces violaceusniger TaxID=68280 RepID=A0A4D4KXS2_STRVO|nr:hypothetical protein SVIO_017710 [Streptomyces violaceusniger]
MADLRTPHAPGRVRRLVPLGIRDLALLPTVVLLLVIGALGNPGFLTRDNLVNILGASSALGLLVLAEAMILISGRMDLSLESIAGLAPRSASWSSSRPPTRASAPGGPPGRGCC